MKSLTSPPKLERMGRCAKTIEFYARHRKSYPPEFSRKVAEEIGLCGAETLLDVGCGPGILTIGFAPFVGGCSGLDPVPLGGGEVWRGSARHPDRPPAIRERPNLHSEICREREPKENKNLAATASSHDP